MLRSITLLALALFFATRLHAQEAGSADSVRRHQEDGRALAAAVMKAVGGESAWSDKSWNLEFDFVVLRGGKEAARFSHKWDRASNAYVVSGKTQEKKEWRVAFTDINAHKGTATIDGAPAPDSLLPRLLDMGYGRYINDTYWFLMPFKLLDPGVNHWRQPDTVIDGKTFNVLRLSFGSVGLTPGDRYWLYINPETKLVERWRYLLEGGNTGDFYWRDYTDYGPVKLPLRREAVGGGMEIRFENIRVGRFEVHLDPPRQG
jgi:hypothetical protein